jgi:hypothetical protein
MHKEVRPGFEVGSSKGSPCYFSKSFTHKSMYDGGRIREKGVDVKLAIDVVIGAADNLFVR